MRQSALYEIVRAVAVTDERLMSLGEYRALREQAQALLTGPVAEGESEASE
jgi:hypothetical protein